MKKISIIILAGKNNGLLENCLKTALWADEIIIINTGLKDKVLRIAKNYNCKIIKASKEYNFANWRNEGAKSAKTDWLLYLDTDERISSKLKQEILKIIHQSSIINHQSSANAYYLARKNYFLGKEFKTVWPDYQLRLIKKKALISWQGKLHENPKIKGKIGYLKNPLIHLAFNHQNLENAVLNTLHWSKLEAENRFKSGHPAMTGWRFFRILVTGFWRQFVKKGIWREGTEGVIEGIYQTFSLFFTYVRLWQLQRKETLEKSYRKIEKRL